MSTGPARPSTSCPASTPRPPYQAPYAEDDACATLTPSVRGQRSTIGTLTGQAEDTGGEVEGEVTGAPEAAVIAIPYSEHVRCPFAQNLIPILGDTDGDDETRACTSVMCDLQLEGTGDSPDDVLLDNEYSKLNGIRADRADGVYFRNFTIQQAEFNSLYVMESDGFVIDRVVARANDEYGFLAFASDHGLFTDCEGYYNGDSAIYPGSASDLYGDVDEFGQPFQRYAIEITRCKMHDNALGYSGTAGNAVYAHDNDIWGNGTGIATDSFFPDHPGLPQDHARFENNRIWGNNRNYYTEFVDTGVCDRPIPERGYLTGTVCPAIPVPVGTGVLIAGGNYNWVNENTIWDNHRAGVYQFWVPAAIRNEFEPEKQYDTSNGNHYTDNVFGIHPSGVRQPNGVDAFWDEEGRGTCYQGNTGFEGAAMTNNFVAPVPDCDSGGNVFSPGVEAKLLPFVTCTQYDKSDDVMRHPPGCDWFDQPAVPEGRVAAADEVEPVVPEVPLSALVPLSAAAVLGGAAALGLRRRRTA